MKAAQSKGEVYLCSLSKLRHLDTTDKYVFMITRGKRSIEGVRSTPELAPSRSLFSRYNSEWKGKPGELWWPVYKAKYLEELNTDFITKLKFGLDSGKHVVLVCFCGQGTYCHRTLLGEVFTDLGYTVHYN